MNKRWRMGKHEQASAACSNCFDRLIAFEINIALSRLEINDMMRETVKLTEPY